VGLEALELVEGREMRVAVVEADHEADRHLVVLEVIEEGAAIGPGVERPADGVDDQPGLCLAGSTSHSSLMPMP
jgi:hypothetical protein